MKTSWTEAGAYVEILPTQFVCVRKLFSFEDRYRSSSDGFLTAAWSPHRSHLQRGKSLCGLSEADLELNA